ncbi:MAG TPA: cupin domain-containing protein [Longilinea sp.]|nr:cupin domain-containing protein [Longilinea sp.]
MSTIHRFTGEQTDCTWEKVPVYKYGDEFKGVTRQIIIGPDDHAPNFAIRYFRVEPGKHTSLDQHPHEHGVVIVHGRARLQINHDFYELGPMDAVFISGNDVHQFTALGDEPLGFFCTVPANR